MHLSTSLSDRSKDLQSVTEKVSEINPQIAILMGDLNFRINLSYNSALERIK